MIYAKIAGIIALFAALAWGVIADYDAGKHAGSDAVTKLWDDDKAAIQQAADAQIATITKQRDEALTANEAIQNDYQAKLSSANANASLFAQRLRNAENLIAANRSAVPESDGGSKSTPAGAQSSAAQLGELVSLVTGLNTECKANADQLDALIGEIKRQL